MQGLRQGQEESAFWEIVGFWGWESCASFVKKSSPNVMFIDVRVRMRAGWRETEGETLV